MAKKAVIVANLVFFPAYPLRIKFLNALVKYFPRRLLPKSRYNVLSKYTAHPTLLIREISNLDKISLPTDFTVKIASNAEIAQLAEHDEGLPLEVYQNRQLQGDRCICIYNKNELVSYNWLTFSRAGIYLGFKKEISFLNLLHNQVFSYDFYTYKKHRNMGYGTLLKSCIFQYLFSQNIDEILTCVHPDNGASLAVHVKQGYNLKRMVFCARIMEWNVSFFSNPKETKVYQAWFRLYKEGLLRKCIDEEN